MGSIAEDLLEYGKEVANSVLPDCYEGSAMNALDAVRRAACCGDTTALNDPPPALFHPSGFSCGDFLYGTVHPSPFSDAPYKNVETFVREQVNPYRVHTGKLIGALLMDVLERDDPCPAFLFWRESDRTLYTIVSGAPLGGMEAELGKPLGKPSALERMWMGDDAADLKMFRNTTLAYIRTCGMKNFNAKLLSTEYAIERSGVLPYLRLRRAKDDVERAKLMEDLERMHVECEKAREPLALMRPSEVLGPEMRPFRMTTIFTRGFFPHAPDPYAQEFVKENVNWGDFLRNPLVSTLSLSILLKGVEYDYTSEAGKMPLPDTLEDIQLSARDNTQMRDTIQRLSEQEIGTPDVQADMVGPPVVASSALSRMLGMTLRTYEIQCLVKYDSPSDACAALASCLFRDEEPVVINAAFKSSQRLFSSNASTRIRAMAKAMDDRFAILSIALDNSNNVTSVALQWNSTNASSGHETLRMEETVRLLLCPWVTPLVIKEKSVDRISIAGVTREKLRLSEAHRKSYMSSVDVASKSDVEKMRSEFQEGLERVKEAVGKRPAAAPGLPAISSEGADKLGEILPLLRKKVKA